MTTDFFDPRPEAAPARLALTVDVMRNSAVWTIRRTCTAFTAGDERIFPTARQISLSRRDLARRRSASRASASGPRRSIPGPMRTSFRSSTGGLFSEMIHSGRPRLIEELVVSADDPALPYLQGQRSLLASTLYEAGDAANMVVVTRGAERISCRACPRTSLDEQSVRQGNPDRTLVSEVET